MITRDDVLKVLRAEALASDNALRPMEIAKRIAGPGRPISSRGVTGLIAALHDTDLIEQVDVWMPYWDARNTRYRDRRVNAYRIARKGLIAALVDEQRAEIRRNMGDVERVFPA